MTGTEQGLIAAMNTIPSRMEPRLIYADWLEEQGRTDEASFLRLVRMTGGEFSKSVVAHDDDNDYSESGWVVVRVRRGEVDYGLIARYSHCSCYDTWASICGGGLSDYYAEDVEMEPSFDWVGTWDAVVKMASESIDPMTGCVANERTEDADHLAAVWVAVIASSK